MTKRDRDVQKQEQNKIFKYTIKKIMVHGLPSYLEKNKKVQKIITIFRSKEWNGR